MTTFTPGGQKLADVLVKVGVIPKDRLAPHLWFGELNNAASSLGLEDPAGAGDGLRDALERINKSDRQWIERAALEEGDVVIRDDGTHHKVLVLKTYGRIAHKALSAEARPTLARTQEAEGQAGGGVEELRRKLVAFDVREEVDQYEFRGDEGDYMPTERERVLLEDFGNGLASAIGDVLFPALTSQPTTPAPATATGSAGEDDTGVREVRNPRALPVMGNQAHADRALSAGDEFVMVGDAPGTVRRLGEVPQPPKAETPAGVEEIAKAILRGQGHSDEAVEAIQGGGYLHWHSAVRSAKEVAALTAPAARPGEEVEPLKAALKPFAAYADPRRRMPADMAVTAGSAIAKRQLTMGDCYAAADALAAAPAADGGRA